MRVILGLFYIFVSKSFGLREIPERARGGSAYQKFVQTQSSITNKYIPKIWQAKVDNFDDLNNHTYSQRYYVDDTYWLPGKGPVFLEIGGEGTLSGPPSGYVATLAKNYSALLISVEHRYYGQSMPTATVTADDLKLLTVEQALADLAAFTDYYKMTVPQANSAWFVFGGSYPGALASWYRHAYPEHSKGSLSSSGVVNCIVDYSGFDTQVAAATGNDCANNIRRVQSAFENTIQSSPAGFSSALSLFQCEKDMSHEDFYYMIADSWSMMVQYNSKTMLCSALDAGISDQSTDEQVMALFSDLSNDYWGKDFCAQGFYNTKALGDPTRWDVNSRSWRWQTCYQVSYFNTAPPGGSLRALSVNLEYHLRQCASIFGQVMYPSSTAMNSEYGGAFPAAERVFYSDFSDDPWQRASVTAQVGSAQPYAYSVCEDCGHCSDFHTPSDNDPQPIKASRAEFEKYLNLWLNQ